MSEKFDYTVSARRFWSTFPVLAFVGIQVNFWIVANMLLGVILHLQFIQINQALNTAINHSIGPVLIVAVIFGVGYGLILGLAGYYLEKKLYRRKSLGKIILFNTIFSFIVLVLLLMLLRFVLLDLVMPDYKKVYQLTDQSWRYFFFITLVYYFFMTVLVNFINQVNQKFGPGVLLPLLLGKYRKPREEERIFMFMDLKSSTSIAEKLGHLPYSSLIQDSFSDINQVVHKWDADIYQYVGDEIVLSWRLSDGIRHASCLQFYFACQEEFLKRSSYYREKYGMVPEFKAGVHGGIVTAVEIGNIKKDIAYHGDVLNTAARIQGLCNQFNQQLLVSTELCDKIQSFPEWKTEKLGMINIKGKQNPVEISAIVRH